MGWALADVKLVNIDTRDARVVLLRRFTVVDSAEQCGRH